MSLNAGSHKLGPDNARLTVETGRSGAAAKAGHDLVIEVTSWQASFDVGPDPAQTSIVLSADPRSLRVRAGTGGIQGLGEDDRAGIDKTIDEEVLARRSIEFRSSQVKPAADGSGLQVSGELELGKRTRPLAFELAVDEQGRLTGTAKIKQSDWGMKPYSTLFGVLKVADEVRVLVEADLSPAATAP